VVSTIGTVPDTSIYFFDFDKQTISVFNINEQSGAKYSMYDSITKTFSLAIGQNQNLMTYVYETNELVRVKQTESREQKLSAFCLCARHGRQLSAGSPLWAWQWEPLANDKGAYREEESEGRW